MSDELNVWRELFQEFQALRRASCLDEAEQEVAAVIRTYGDKRYQQAIADVVEWLGAGFDTYQHGTFARCREMHSYWVSAAQEITRRFGKDA